MEKIHFYIFIVFLLLVAGCNKEKQKEKLLEQIQNLQDRQEYSQALEKSTALVKKFPKQSQSYILQGEIFAEMDRLSEAKQAFSKAIDLDPQNGDSYLHRAQINFMTDNSSEAFADCVNAIKLQPTEEAYEICAPISVQAKDYKQAADWYSKLLALNPQNAEVFYFRGVVKENYLHDKKGGMEDFLQAGILYTDQEDYKKAIKIFNVVAQKVPSSQVFRQRGRAKFHLSDLAGAEKDFSHAIMLNPNDWQLYMARCAVRVQRKDARGTIQDCNRVVSSAPKDSPLLISAYSAIILTKFEHHDYQGAYQASQTAIRSMPDVFDFYVLRADTIPNFKEQLPAISQALQLYEQRKVYTYNIDLVANAYALRGSLRKYFGEHKGAIQDFTRAIELQPNNAENYQMRGKSKQQIGDTKGAKEDFAQAKKLSSQSQ